MSIAISGSIAFDTIMVFEGRFADHILPDQVQMLNVAFLAPTMRQEFGGCAANIAYGLRLLKADVVVLGALGSDGAAYHARLKSLGIDVSAIVQRSDCYTAQAFITTDLADNQITAFHPGAMMRSYENHVRDVPGVGFGIVGPDGYEAMLQNCTEFAECGIPFIFDPGQAMPLYNGEELRRMIDQATYVTVNDYESSLLQERTGWLAEVIASKVKAYFITRGPKGSEVHTPDGMIHIPSATAMRVVDPTGCGDAYRAGLIFGFMNNLDLATTGRIASLMGALKIEHLGPQNQRFDYAGFAEQFRQQFGYAL